MQITIAGGDTNDAPGSSRKVARDVDIENFTVLDQVIYSISSDVYFGILQVGEEEGEKSEASSKTEQNQNRSSHKSEEPVDLEKVVIKFVKS